MTAMHQGYQDDADRRAPLSEEDVERIAALLVKNSPRSGGGVSGDKTRWLALTVVVGAFALFGSWVWNPWAAKLDDTGKKIDQLTAMVRDSQERTARELANHAARLDMAERVIWTTRGNPEAPTRLLPHRDTP
jgi:hypothetical protein